MSPTTRSMARKTTVVSGMPSEAPTNIVTTPAKEDQNQSPPGRKISSEKGHHKEKRFGCSKCGRSFSRVYDLKVHNDSVHPETRPFSCPKCNKSFALKRSLNYHISSGHQISVCPRCNKTFNWGFRLSRHIRSCQRSCQPLVCSKCCKAFTRRSDLSRHLRSKEHEIISRFKPTMTGYDSTSTQILLAPNSKEATNIVTTPAKEDQNQSPPGGLGKMISLEKGQHGRVVHHEEKRFNCSECGRLFSRHYNLKIHIYSVHPEMRPVPDVTTHPETYEEFFLRVMNTPLQGEKGAGCIDDRIEQGHDSQPILPDSDSDIRSGRTSNGVFNSSQPEHVFSSVLMPTFADGLQEDSFVCEQSSVSQQLFPASGDYDLAFQVYISQGSGDEGAEQLLEKPLETMMPSEAMLDTSMSMNSAGARSFNTYEDRWSPFL